MPTTARAPPGDALVYLRERPLRQRLSRSRHSQPGMPGGLPRDVLVCDPHTPPAAPWAYWRAASLPPSSPASRAKRLRVLRAREGHWLAAGSGGRKQEGLMRQRCQYKHRPGHGDQQPGPQHGGPARATGPVSRLLRISCREPIYRARMLHRHRIPLSPYWLHPHSTKQRSGMFPGWHYDSASSGRAPAPAPASGSIQPGPHTLGNREWSKRRSR